MNVKTPIRFIALRSGLVALVLAAVLEAPLSRAQTIAPPNLMSYQGYLTDGSGNPLGATNTGPKNYNVVFRLWNVQNGGTVTNNELYAEQQTVTVDNGYFSVMLGQGTAYPGEPFPQPLSSVFVNSQATQLFVEFVVLGIGQGGVPVTIAPRLQLLSSPYAFLAANANSLANASGSTLLTGTPGGALTVSGPVNTGTNIISGNGSGLTSLNAASLTGIVPSASLPSTVVTNTESGVTLSGTFSGNGSGLTTLNPNVPLLNGNNNFSGQNSFGQFVGIGTASPVSQLHVLGGDVVPQMLTESPSISGTWLGVRNTSPGGRTWVMISTGSGNGEGPAKLLFNGANGNVMTLCSSNNYVGIGQSSPTAPLEVDGFDRYHTTAAGDFIYGNIVSEPVGTPIDASIKASSTIVGANFFAYSDSRIKNIIGRSDSARDLDALIGIEITDYTYKDTVAKGSHPQKKVIAQQVEQIYPQAVGQRTDVVPDIYQKADIKDGWVLASTDLKVGERVKLIGEKEASVRQVVEVRYGAFRTDSQAADGKVFVYGREVKDFRFVDYEAISMLNVSATQELAKKLEAQQAELKKLEAKFSQALAEKETLHKYVALLEERDRAREERLARMESSLAKSAATSSYASVAHP